MVEYIPLCPFCGNYPLTQDDMVVCISEHCAIYNIQIPKAKWKLRLYDWYRMHSLLLLQKGYNKRAVLQLLKLECLNHILVLLLRSALTAHKGPLNQK